MFSLRPDRLFLVVLSLSLTVYALTHATWNRPTVMVSLMLLLAIIEFFPLHINKVRLPVAFPLLYAMVIVSGLEATLLLGSVPMLFVQLVRRQPLQSLLFTCLARVIALIGGASAAHALSTTGLAGPELPGLLLHLIVFLVVYVILMVSLYSWRSAVASTHYQMMRNSLLQAAAWNLLISFCYSGMMHWIAVQRPSDGGVLGAIFFFMPLVALAVVLHLITNLSHTKSKLETLFSISQTIHQQHDMQTVLQHVIREATRLVQGSCGLFYLVQEGGTLQQVPNAGARGPAIRFPKHAGLVGHAVSTGETLLVPDVSRDPRLHPGETHAYVRTLLLVPIFIDGKVAGVMSLGKRDLDPFQPDDLKLITIFTTHATAAIKKAMMIEEREKRLLLEERNRLAREIHDGLAQDLAGSIFQIDLLKRQGDEELRDRLNELQEVLRKSVATVRHSIYSLRPAPYAQQGLVPSMRQQLDDIESQQGLSTHLTVALPPEPLPTPITKAVFQIFNEAVQNVVKHAEAQDLHIALTGDEEALTLSIRDNGKGFHFGKAIVQAAARHSFGIENLHNIADEIGGTLDYVTAPGMGTEVVLRIPLKEEEDDDNSRVAL